MPKKSKVETLKNDSGNVKDMNFSGIRYIWIKKYPLKILTSKRKLFKPLYLHLQLPC
jgi:hypothetical protein